MPSSGNTSRKTASAPFGPKPSLEGRNFLEHGGAPLGHGGKVPIIRDRLKREDRRERGADIADRVHRENVGIPVNVRRLHIEADERRGFRHPGFVIELHRVVAHGQHQIGLLMRDADLVAERVEEDSGVTGMVLGQHAFRHRRQNDGDPVLLGESSDFALQFRLHGAETDREDRLARFGEELGRATQQGGIGGRRGLGRHEMDGFAIRFLGGHSNRQADMHRTGPSFQRDPGGVEEHRLDGIGAQPGRLFRQWTEQSLVVDPHLRGAAAHRRGHLVGESEHGRTVEQGAPNPGGQIGCAGTEGAETGARLTREPAADVGHHAGGAFMRGQDEFDAVGLAQRFHVVDPAAARHAENIFHAELAQGLHENRRDGLIFQHGPAI